MRLLFEGGFYSRAAFIGDFTVYTVNGWDRSDHDISDSPNYYTISYGKPLTYIIKVHSHQEGLCIRRLT